ncbi:HdeD family acid-resistance protein [bacterium]|nr:HdeD family acid-resistance protein [bacterium]
MNISLPMLAMLRKYWWTILLRGIIAALFGIAAFVWPGITIVFLIWLFGAYALLDGIISVVIGIAQYGENERWWGILLQGICGIAVGLMTFLWPQVTGLILLYFIAGWAILTGLFQIVAALRLRKVISGEWLLGLSGVISVLFGITLFVYPAAGALAVIWMIGIFAILNGLLLIFLSLRVRS